MRKIYTLLLTLGTGFVSFGQAPDGFPDTFITTGGGTFWNDPATWTNLDFSEDLGGDFIPDGDDIVIVNHSVTVASNAGFGELVIENGSSTTITLTINDGVSLIGSFDYHFGTTTVRALSSLTVFTNLDINGGIFSCGSLNMESQNSGRAYFKVRNGGEATIDGDLTFNGSSTTTVQVQALLGLNNTVNLSGDIINTGVLNFGTNSTSSTLNFNGTSPQSIPDFGVFSRYSNIEINNLAGVSLTGDLKYTGVASSSNLSGSLTIASGELNDAGFDITLPGNFINNGVTFNQSVGSAITFAGTAAQTLSGNNNWQTLNLNNGSGLTLSSGTQNITKVLDIDAGTFNNSGGDVILLSNASGTAQLADVGTGDYTGNITAQRRISKGAQGFLSLASPVKGTTLANWNDGGVGSGQELIFTGFPGSNYPTFGGGYVNAMMYNEVSSGANKDDGWANATNITNPTGAANNYKAHFIYADAVTYNMSVTGVPNTKNISIPLDYNAVGGAANDGWNFIGNPYPCTIDWDAVSPTLSNVSDFYSVYSYDAGNFAYYDGSINAGANGATRYVPSSQGIWVQATASTSLNLTESMKDADQDASFVKSNSIEPMRMKITGNVNGFYDEGFLLADAMYSNDYETSDRGKMSTYDPSVSPTLYTLTADNVPTAINKINNSSSVSIPLMAKSGTAASGIYTLDFVIPANFFENACLTLEDLHTGAITDLRSVSSYTYTTSDTTTVPRFVIHAEQSVSTNISDASCGNTTDGALDVTGNGITGSEFELTNQIGAVVFNGAATSDNFTIANLAAGTYTLTSNYSGGCAAVAPITIVIDGGENIVADFAVSGSLEVGQSVEDVLTNNSVGSTYAWDFGDGTTSADILPNHTYTQAGTYTVTLTVTNDNGCDAVTSNSMVVEAQDVSSVEENASSAVDLIYFDGKIRLTTHFSEMKVVNLKMLDLSGKVVQTYGTRQLTNQEVIIPLKKKAAGMYIFLIEYDGTAVSKKLVIE